VGGIVTSSIPSAALPSYGTAGSPASTSTPGIVPANSGISFGATWSGMVAAMIFGVIMVL